MGVVVALRSGSGWTRWVHVLAQLALLASCGVDNEVAPVRGGDSGMSDDPWALPLSFTVDPSLRPSSESVAMLDGRERRVEVLASPDGETMELLADELIVGTVDDEALEGLTTRRGGEVLWKVGGGSPTEPGFSLVRIEPGPADPEGVARLLRNMDEEGVGLEGGEQRVSHPDVLALLAAMLEESEMMQAPVSPNVVMSLATVGTGTTVEADDVGSSGLTRDACTWPHMRSGGAQDIGVCDAWRLLVQQGKDGARVDVGVLDQGFAATPDTPEGSAFHVPGMLYEGGPFWEGPEGQTGCPEGSACGWHGTWTSSALGAVPDNAWGGAGPGGLNARIQHIEPVALLSAAIQRRLGHGPITLDQLQAGLVAATAERLPEGGVVFIGIASRIPWPLSILVHHAMDPVFAGAREAGILVFAPAGKAHDVDHVHVLGSSPNAGWETALTFPCELSSVVCVGGLARDSNRRDPQSGYGSRRPAGFRARHELGTVDIYGPGTVAVGPDPDDELNASSSLLRERRGTSLAAAFTAGVAVQVWAADPTLSPDAVEGILYDTMHTGSASPEVNGWVDAFAAVEDAACTDPVSFHRDGDGDGYGDPDATEAGCLAPAGYVSDGGDCDDTDQDIHPGAEERCDGVDQNCDPDDEDETECDDGLFCTRDDACEDGECTSSGSPCDSDQSCDEDEDECTARGCGDAADCDDGRYCNGDERCDEASGECRTGSRDPSDDVACTVDLCDESEDRVDHVPDDGECDDGDFCNGAETCDADDGCQPGQDPCPSQLCNESTDVCVPCTQDADCNDGLYCNGVESCNTGAGLCVPGTPPALSDGVDCTIDSCDEATDGIVHTTNDAACDDGTFCNGPEICHATLDCQPGIAPTLPDGVPCTVDSCDEANDRVVHAPSDVVCSDGVFCNGPEVCSPTQGCQAGTAPSIDDGVPCTNDSCDESTDSVEHAPDNADCDDGLYCNGGETCHATQGCQVGTAPVLTDSVACTVDSCNEATDSVVHAPSAAACDDGQYCNGGETCHAVLGCQLGSAPCVVSICDEALNFCDFCLDDDDCDDGGYCNGAETCNTATGECLAGVAPSADDDVDCTVDSCDEATDGFVHTPDDAACSDGIYCDGAEVCDELLDCVGGTPPSAADAFACTIDTCDEPTDSFVHTPVNAACNDTLYCTGTESCNVATGCQASGNPCSGSQCNDTLDACVTCLNSGHCQDGLFCNGPEVCNVGLGTCGAGMLAGLDDGIGCTTDSCTEATDTISHTPVNAACNDGLYCDGVETCSATLDCQDGANPCVGGCTEATDTCFQCNQDSDCNDAQYCNGVETCDTQVGMCVPGTGPALSDGVSCTVDSCNETTDSIDHVPSSALCTDAAFCNGAEVCDVVDGCGPGTPPTLTDGVPCTTDTCNEATDSVDHVPSAAACGNGLYCDGAETCHALNGCQAGTPPTLTDGVPCTTDSCDEATDSIVHTPSAGACDDALFCNGAESCHPTFGCQPGTPPATDDGVGCTTDTCVEATDSITHMPSAGACSDGAFCNGAEVCHPTNDCQPGTPPTLTDGVGCTNDACDEATDTITHMPSAANCSNLLFCDGAEVCHPTNGCQPGTPPATDDGVPCTTDGCVEATDTITHSPSATFCADGQFCNGVESCHATLGCQSGTPPATGDGVQCTVDGCDEANDVITHAPDDDLCSNGQFCDGVEVCHATNDCQPGTPPATDDGVDCTMDGCSEASDRVTHTPLDSYCANSSFCDGPETCHLTLDCQPGSDPCVDEDLLVCDEANDLCTECLDVTHCDDLDPCTIDSCDAGTCEHTTSPQYYADIDGDGFGGASLGCTNPGGAVIVGGDCNDDASAVYPGASETCNDDDDDCDGVPDDGLTFVDYYHDGDGDRYGDEYFGNLCSDPQGATSDTQGDCDDGDASIHPGAQETCNTFDDDCDGTPDDGLTFVDYYDDIDGDDYGDGYFAYLCSDPGGQTSDTQGDCDDGDASIHPGAQETCNTLDDDCDGTPDEGLSVVAYYYDVDGDDYGKVYYAHLCSDPGGQTSATQGDCDDGDASIHPGGQESCNTVDDDCDGVAEEGLRFDPYYRDSDGDGFGGEYYGLLCEPIGSGVTSNPGDCDDGQNDTYAGAQERCDNRDNDCNGVADDGLELVAYFYDQDQDGCGGMLYGVLCSGQPSGTVTTSGECDQDDDVDSRCACASSCPSPVLYYRDSDRDGYGGDLYAASCDGPFADTTATPGDCDDLLAASYPNADEQCDLKDNDCDGAADDGVDITMYYDDGDGDGYGSSYYGGYCSPPAGDFSSTPFDCDDGSPDYHPGASELCDNYDNDCDGQSDEGCP